jgi:hypothetical protein
MFFVTVGRNAVDVFKTALSVARFSTTAVDVPAAEWEWTMD